ncbi:MAG: lipopolysaccharide assembly protein LapA domain-containing protein [Acetobacterales bacterium]
MRLFHWLVLVPFAMLVVSFAVSNLDTVTIELQPLPFSLQTPLYLLVLLVGLLSFFIGSAVMWAASLGARRRARRSEEQLARLEREMADMRRQLDAARAEVEKAAAERTAAPRSALPKPGPVAERAPSGPVLDHRPEPANGADGDGAGPRTGAQRA